MPRGARLQPREELVRVLVLAHVDGLAVVVLERAPEALRAEVVLVAQRERAEHRLPRAPGRPQARAGRRRPAYIAALRAQRRRRAGRAAALKVTLSPAVYPTVTLDSRASGRRARLQLVEHARVALGGRRLARAQHQRADARLHEQLLEHRVHVARRARILQAHKAARPPAARARARPSAERPGANAHAHVCVESSGRRWQRPHPPDLLAWTSVAGACAR